MADDQTKAAKAAKADAPKASAGKPAKTSGPKPAPKSSKAQTAEPNFFQKIGKYFRDVRVEMRRVVWPNRAEVVQSSVVVVVALAFFIVYVLLWDTVSWWAFIDLPAKLFGGK